MWLPRSVLSKGLGLLCWLLSFLSWRVALTSSTTSCAITVDRSLLTSPCLKCSSINLMINNENLVPSSESSLESFILFIIAHKCDIILHALLVPGCLLKNSGVFAPWRMIFSFVVLSSLRNKRSFLSTTFFFSFALLHACSRLLKPSLSPLPENMGCLQIGLVGAAPEGSVTRLAWPSRSAPFSSPAQMGLDSLMMWSCLFWHLIFHLLTTATTTMQTLTVLLNPQLRVSSQVTM